MNPNTLPTKITTRAAWLGTDMQSNPDLWLIYPSPENITDLEQAALDNLPLGHGVEDPCSLPIETYTREMTPAIICGCFSISRPPAQGAAAFYGVRR